MDGIVKNKANIELNSIWFIHYCEQHFTLVSLFNQQLPHKMTINGNIQHTSTCNIIAWLLLYLVRLVRSFVCLATAGPYEHHTHHEGQTQNWIEFALFLMLCLTPSLGIECRRKTFDQPNESPSHEYKETIAAVNTEIISMKKRELLLKSGRWVWSIYTLDESKQWLVGRSTNQNERQR